MANGKVKYFSPRTIISFIAGVIILILIFRNQNLNQLFSALKQADFKWIIFGKLFTLSAHYLRALRWNIFFRTIKKMHSVKVLFSGIILGYFFNLLIPRAGELVKCSYVNKKENISFGKIMGTLGAERVIDFISLWVLVLVVLTFQLDNILKFIETKIHISINIYWTLVVATVFLLMSIFVLVMVKKYKHLSWIKKILLFIDQLKQGFMAILKIDGKSQIQFIVLTIFIWTGYAANIYFTFKGIEYTEQISFLDSFFVLVFSGFSMLAPIQGGIGAYHWMVTQALILLGLTYDSGLISATILHASNYLFMLIVGILFLLAEPLKITKFQQQQ
ncbi:MAG: UPF0104 family protein [Bacteroidetes bacterium]|nr:MAG: UPF0104 family protein [Bacteroidota bacterium]